MRIVLLIVVSFVLGCRGEPAALSCDRAALGECIDYVGDAAEFDGARACPLAGGVLQHEACAARARVGRCELSLSASAPAGMITSYYPPHSASDARAACTALPVDPAHSRFVPTVTVSSGAVR